MLTPQLVDQIKGLIFGQAIGDALGLGTEFMSKQQVHQHYPDLLTDYWQIVQDQHRSRWLQGEWTDDTDQMICILDSLIVTRQVNSYNIATRIYDWAFNAGRGIGQTVHKVLTHPAFLSGPYAAAREIWQEGNRQGAANGGVMRTAILGVWDYQKPQKIKINAEKVCKITHYDPRCVGSCVVICLAVGELLKGEKDMDRIIQYLIEEADAYDERIQAYIKPQRSGLSNFFVSKWGDLVYQKKQAPRLTSNLADLELSEPESIGYTLKAMGAGIWALKYAKSYEDGILQIVHEGGDADTNASVAGAILGTKFGYSQIPKRWIKGLLHRNFLEEKIEKLLQVLDKKTTQST